MRIVLIGRIFQGTPGGQITVGFIRGGRFGILSGDGRFARQMTLMELLGMERLQLQTRSELETLRQEARAAQVRRQLRPSAARISHACSRIDHL